MKLRLPAPVRWMRQVGWRTLVGGVLTAGIVHIGATFAVPLIGPGNAFVKLAETLPVNRMQVLPAATPSTQLLPYMAADALYAACRYDVGSAPVSITVHLADPGWTLSLHTPQGDNYYVMSATQLRRSEVSFQIVPPADHTFDFQQTQRAPSGEETQVESPTREGLVLLRAPLRGLAWRGETEARLRRSSCTPAPTPEQR